MPVTHHFPLEFSPSFTFLGIGHWVECSCTLKLLPWIHWVNLLKSICIIILFCFSIQPRFIECLLWARHCAKCFKWRVSFNALNIELLVVFLLNKEEETKVQKVSDLFRVTQLVSIETMTQTLACLSVQTCSQLTKSPCLFPAPSVTD